MKKKVLTASILIVLTVLTAIAMIGYFVGCSQFGGDAVSSRTTDQSSEEGDVTFAELSDKSDSEPQVVTKPQAILSQLQEETAKKDEVHLRTQLEVMKEAEEAAPTAIKSEEYGMLRNEDVTDLRYQQEILSDLKYKSEESKLPKFVGGPVPMPGERPESRFNGLTGRYGMDHLVGNGRSSRAAPSTGQPLRRVRGRAYYDYMVEPSSAEAQRSGGRRIPIELVNVTADEIWVIARPETQAVPAGEDTPGCGAMLAKLPKEDKEIPLPLKHTEVKGQICGYIATVDVTQQFHNPYDEKIEAVYVFPLPQNAAINEFIMTIGERRIRGIIRERKEAEEIYRQARRQGYVASLLTQERPNIFTQKVANIEPGKNIDINIKYFNTLACVDG